MHPMRPMLAALLLLGGAPLGAQTVGEVVAATRARHQAMAADVDSFRVEGTALGGRFVVDARRVASGWEVSAAPGSDAGAPFDAGRMVQLAVEAVLSVGDALAGRDSVRLADGDTLRGRPVLVLVLPPDAGGRLTAGGGRIEEARLLVDPADHTVRSFRMSGTISDQHGIRGMRMVLDFDEYAAQGPVRLPGWMRVSMIGAVPPLDEAQRMQLEAALEVGRAALGTTAAEERPRMEAFLGLLDGILNQNQVVVEARVESVSG